jgi:hypothetical protein
VINSLFFGESPFRYTFVFFDVFLEISAPEAQGLAMLAVLAM